jgi:hypothetical protein
MTTENEGTPIQGHDTSPSAGDHESVGDQARRDFLLRAGKFAALPPRSDISTVDELEFLGDSAFGR